MSRMTHPQTRPRRGRALRWTLGVAAMVFGALTVRAGANVLFGGVAARAGAGDVVDFVLLFNFSASFVYVATGISILLCKRWSIYLARILAAATVLIFAALGVHIARGGAFEVRTVAAMILRSAFWIAQAVALARIFKPEAELPEERG